MYEPSSEGCWLVPAPRESKFGYMFEVAAAIVVVVAEVGVVLSVVLTGW